MFGSGEIRSQIVHTTVLNKGMKYFTNTNISSVSITCIVYTIIEKVKKHQTIPICYKRKFG